MSTTSCERYTVLYDFGVVLSKITKVFADVEVGKKLNISFSPSFSLSLRYTCQKQSTVSTVYLTSQNPSTDAISQTVKTVVEIRNGAANPKLKLGENEMV